MNYAKTKSGVRVEVFARKMEKQIYSDDWNGSEFKAQENMLMLY